MPLSAASKLGPYEILAAIGAGGMGEVYRAKDTKLEREAKVLASLNHPNIAQIYGIEESDGVRALVMELVPGEPLQGRSRLRPLSTTPGKSPKRWRQRTTKASSIGISSLPIFW
jgi:serine/threonine protein kinase